MSVTVCAPAAFFSSFRGGQDFISRTHTHTTFRRPAHTRHSSSTPERRATSLFFTFAHSLAMTVDDPRVLFASARSIGIGANAAFVGVLRVLEETRIPINQSIRTTIAKYSASIGASTVTELRPILTLHSSTKGTFCLLPPGIPDVVAGKLMAAMLSADLSPYVLQ